MSWQYNGIEKWNTIIDWCEEYLYNDYTTNRHETIFFKSKEAELLFCLRWS